MGMSKAREGEPLWTRRHWWLVSGYGEMDFDPKLFARPENVKIEESK
jgi:hypothetical protein